MWFQGRAYKAVIQKLTNKNADISCRILRCRRETITILYIRQLTDTSALAENVINPLVNYCTTAHKALTAYSAVESVLYADACRFDRSAEAIELHILNGMTVIIFSNDKEYAVVNLKCVAHRQIAEPELQYNMRSPRDCFVENLDVNLSLIRYRLKDNNLRIETLNVGARTETRVALAYINDIAGTAAVNEIRRRISAIDTDGILESGELQAFIQNSKWSLFPEMLTIERSDFAVEMMLEGKIVVLVEGSGLALAAPVAFVEFLYACDDRYENKFFSTFARLIRYAAFFLSLAASSYWVALISFHSDTLPANFIISLAQARSKVPFNALFGVLLLEFIMELIRESLLRVPNKIGSAIAIVSAIIIGQAAISAGVFSALLLILISVEFLASFAIPSQFAANPFRIIKFMLLLITGSFGFYGFILGIIVVVAEMVSVKSFGVPYLAPYGPFNLYDFLRTFMFNLTVSPKRQQYMKNKDDTRTGRKKQKPD